MKNVLVEINERLEAVAVRNAHQAGICFLLAIGGALALYAGLWIFPPDNGWWILAMPPVAALWALWGFHRSRAIVYRQLQRGPQGGHGVPFYGYLRMGIRL